MQCLSLLCPVLCICQICLDGRVSFDYADFFVALLQLCQIEQQENLFKAFSVFDQDLSGYITAEELKRACDKYRVNKLVVEEMMREVTRDGVSELAVGCCQKLNTRQRMRQGSQSNVMAEYLTLRTKRA